MSRPRTLACTTTRRLPFSRLIWFGPSRERERARPRFSGMAAAIAPASARRQRDRQVLQRLEIAAHRIRQAHHDLEAPVALEDDARFAPADRGADHILHAARLRPRRAISALSTLDLQHRQPVVCSTRTSAAPSHAAQDRRRSGWRRAASARTRRRRPSPRRRRARRRSAR